MSDWKHPEADDHTTPETVSPVDKAARRSTRPAGVSPGEGVPDREPGEESPAEGAVGSAALPGGEGSE